MKFASRLAHWLETRWVTPSYSGWLLTGAAIFFFLAASNTLAGWLYVMSGMIVALNAIAAWLAWRNLRGLTMSRPTILPVSAGDELVVQLQITNETAAPKSLLEVYDFFKLSPHDRRIEDSKGFESKFTPRQLNSIFRGQTDWKVRQSKSVIETIAPKSTYTVVDRQATYHRGVLRWHTVRLRTAAPLGLFWCQRRWQVPALAIVYPEVLPLSRSPLVDEIGRSQHVQTSSDQRAKTATEGQTKSIRPYRWGDPNRLIHWRTSARYGELRVRELEVLTGGQDLLIGLDNTPSWHDPEDSLDFEAAVIAAASLYFYARRQQLQVSLWTPTTGIIQGEQRVLEVLAAIQAGATATAHRPTSPIVWLTADPASLANLPAGSRWVLWPSSTVTASPSVATPGLIMRRDQPLQPQLQSAMLRL
jgi:uncharacterized protein (DUF58 family)